MFKKLQKSLHLEDIQIQRHKIQEKKDTDQTYFSFLMKTTLFEIKNILDEIKSRLEIAPQND